MSRFTGPCPASFGNAFLSRSTQATRLALPDETRLNTTAVRYIQPGRFRLTTAS